jgi:antitoxin HicB
MITFGYPARFAADEDDRIVVRFPDFPEAVTDGKDITDATAEAADCLGSVIAIRMRRKEDLPLPSRVKRGQRLISVPLWIAPKLALYSAMREQRITNSELARRLGCRETVVRRMLDPSHMTRPERIEAALELAGKRLVIAVDDAA